MIIYYQVNDGIGDTKLVDKEMKSNSQLSVLHKIWKIKRLIIIIIIILILLLYIH